MVRGLGARVNSRCAQPVRQLFAYGRHGDMHDLPFEAPAPSRGIYYSSYVHEMPRPSDAGPNVKICRSFFVPGQRRVSQRLALRAARPD